MIGPADAHNYPSLVATVQAMQASASADLHDPNIAATSNARTWDEVVRLSLPLLDKIGQSQSHAIFTFKRTIVSATLSLESSPEGELRWHLSLGRQVLGGPPQRVPDAIVRVLTTVFKTPNEGPAEGALRNVRHFRGPYQDLA